MLPKKNELNQILKVAKAKKAKEAEEKKLKAQEAYQKRKKAEAEKLESDIKERMDYIEKDGVNEREWWESVWELNITW